MAKPHDSGLGTLSYEELRCFIADSQSPVLAEKVATLVYDRTLEADHLRECIALLKPLIADLRERLNERGFPDLRNLRSTAGLSQKNHTMLRSHAILQFAVASGLVLLNDFSDEASECIHEGMSIVEHLGDETLQGEFNLLMGTIEWSTGRGEEAMAFFREAYEKGQKSNAADVMAAALKQLALVLKDRGEYDRAIEYIRTAISIFPTHLPLYAGEEYHLYAVLARLLMEVTRFEEAYKILNDAWNLVKDEEEIRRRLIVLEVLADWYTLSDLLPQGLETAQQLLELARRNGGPSLICNALQRVALIHLKLGNAQFAEARFREAAGIAKGMGHIPRERRLRMNIADALAAQGEYEQALEIYREILDTAFEVDPNLEGIAFLHNVVGDMLVKLGRNDEAGNQYRAALDLCNEAGMMRGKIRTLRSLGGYYTMHGRYKEAVACYEESLQLYAADDEGTARSHLALAEMYEESGDASAGLRHFKEYHRIDNIIGEQLRNNRMNALQAQHRVEWYRQEADREKGHRESIEVELQIRSLSLIEKEELLDTVRKLSMQATADVNEGNMKAALQSLNKIVRWTKKASVLNTEALIKLYTADRDFQEALLRDHPDLTKGQIRLAALIRAGLDNSEIAGMLGTSPDSLMKQRYRLRKMLGLGKGDELERHLGGVGRGGS